MHAKRAAKILGINRTRRELQMMQLALSMHPWNNDHDDNERLSAAKYALRFWRLFKRECDAQRNAK